MGLREIESTLPPGFRFYPSDEELVCHYLYKKVTNESASQGTLVEVDLHTREPWELPDVAKLSANEWYFFSFRDRKYATGSRTNRATKSGYWKATGKDRAVFEPSTRAAVGMRKTLVFYQGRAPSGVKTGWVMHEFRLESPDMTPREDWVLCRVFHKKKGETVRYSLEKEMDNVVGSSSPPSMSDVHQQRLAPCVCQASSHLHNSAQEKYGANFVGQRSDVGALDASQYDFVSFLDQEMADYADPTVGIGGAGEDHQYELLLDMGDLQGYDLRFHVDGIDRVLF